MLHSKVFVLSDHKVITKPLVNNVKCFHLRDVVREDNKIYVVAAKQKQILEILKDKKDDYYITCISSYVLENYCKVYNFDLMYIDNCDNKICEVDYLDTGLLK